MTERVFVLALRSLCTVAGAGCLYLTYRIGCTVFDRVTGVVGAFVLAATPVFLRWSVESHPDFICCRCCLLFCSL